MFKSIGVRGNLLLSFIGISGFAVLTTVAAIYSFLVVQTLIDRITEQRMPIALATEKLSYRVERSLAKTPALLSATIPDERSQSWERISFEIEAIDKLLSLLNNQGFASDTLELLQNDLGLLRANLFTLYTLVGERIELAERKRLILDQMHESQKEVLVILDNWITSEDNNVERLRSSIKNDSISLEDRLLAERELIKSLSLFASLQKTLQSITQVYRILFDITVAGTQEDIDLSELRIQWSLDSLATLSAHVESKLSDIILVEIERFKLFTQGEKNMPLLRANEIALINEGQNLKKQNISISDELTKVVENIVKDTQQDISNATRQARDVRKRSSNILIIIASMSMACSILIVWLYVGRNLIARLTALSSSMLAIADGNLRTTLPEPGSSDEIGRMAEALVTFRDTAIEVEETNLREIEAARRRLVDAIENSSEGFVFFDADDRLVICNTRYRELLHPNAEFSIQPGTKFETIVRTTAENGHIIEARGRVEEWVAERMALHRDPGKPRIQQRTGDQWILITERRTGDGGTVAIYSDISDLKQREEKLEDALEERKQAFSLLAQELSEAADYVKNILPSPLQDGKINIDWQFIPSKSLGGDAFGYHWLDENHFVIYLIDVSGHGVGAALLSVSVINSLRSQSLPDTDFKDPAQVMTALNEAFPGEENNYMFFTIWYGVYNKKSRELVYASGGHPPALFIDDGQENNSRAILLKTANAAIGFMPDITYMKNVHLLKKIGTLYIFSDGVYEVEKEDGSMWQLAEFISFMENKNQTGRGKLDDLYHYVKSINIKDSFEDDFTILAVTFR